MLPLSDCGIHLRLMWAVLQYMYMDMYMYFNMYMYIKGVKEAKTTRSARFFLPLVIYTAYTLKVRRHKLGFSQDRDQLIKTPAHSGDVGKYANISNLLSLLGSESKFGKKETHSVFGGVKYLPKALWESWYVRQG